MEGAGRALANRTEPRVGGHSSAGRASRWQREGQEFESPCLHHDRRGGYTNPVRIACTAACARALMFSFEKMRLM